LSVAKVLGWTISPRRFVREGALSVLVGQEVAEVTSNPTIFQGAIAEGDAYDDQLREVLRSETDPREVFLAVVQRDIQDACDLLWEVFERGDSSRDGWVSLEVDPSLAHDTQATIDEATRLHRMIDRPNLFVKIPGTEAGLSAIEESIARGIPMSRCCFLAAPPCSRPGLSAGLRRLHEAGRDLRTVASVASFFVSRVDSAADRRWRSSADTTSLRVL
jgi:transaldolase